MNFEQEFYKKLNNNEKYEETMHQTLSKSQNVSSERSEKFNDEHVTCYECGEKNSRNCRIHQNHWLLNKRISCSNSTQIIDDTFRDYFNKNVKNVDCNCKSNSLKHIKTTLPVGFHLIKSKVGNECYGVWTKINVFRGTIIGPFLGQIINDNELEYDFEYHCKNEIHKDLIWSLIKTSNVKNGNMIDGRDAMKSNYLRFIRCARNENEQNLKAFQFDGKIFYQAIIDIPPFQELMVSYNKQEIEFPFVNEIYYCRQIPLLPYKYKNFTCNIENTIQQYDNQSDQIRFLSETWKKNSNLSCNEILKLLQKAFPNQSLIPKDTLLKIAVKYNLCPLNGTNAKVNGKIITAIKEILIENPIIGIKKINLLLNKSLPNSHNISDRTICRLIKKYQLRPILNPGFDLDENHVYAIVEMFRKYPNMSLYCARINLQKMFPDKPLVSNETLLGIIRFNRLNYRQYQNRKIDREMMKCLKKIIRKYDDNITIEEINEKLRIKLPNKPKLTNFQISQFLAEFNSTPFKIYPKKINDEMHTFILDSYFKCKLNCQEIKQRLKENFPDKPLLSTSSIFQYISRQNISSESSDSYSYNE